MREESIQTLSAAESLALQEVSSAHQDDMSVESLVLLITLDRLNSVKERTYKELQELKTRQQNVHILHQLLSAINAATDDKGKLDCSKNDDIKQLLTQAKTLGVEIKDDKFKYTKEERDRLVDNIQMASDDYEIENEMQLQTITRLTNDRYESYQMARSILKPLHEDKQRKAREMSGKG